MNSTLTTGRRTAEYLINGRFIFRAIGIKPTQPCDCDFRGTLRVFKGKLFINVAIIIFQLLRKKIRVHSTQQANFLNPKSTEGCVTADRLNSVVRLFFYFFR